MSSGDFSDYVQETIPTAPIPEDILKLILDRSSIPETVIHSLRGEVWSTKMDKEGKVTGRWLPKGRPLMNELGIRFFSPFIYTAMSPDKLVTFLTEEEVSERSWRFTRDNIKIIASKGRFFEIEPTDRTKILALLDDFYFINLTASRGGTLLELMKPVAERKAIYTPQKEKGGWKLPFIG